MVFRNKNMSGALKTELDLGSAISSLEDRVAVLETDFSQMLTTASTLLQATARCADKQETESQCWKMIETIMGTGSDSQVILDNIQVFFQFLLAQMKLKSADVLDVNMLWHLHDNEDIKPSYLAAVKYFGFDTKDHANLKLLLGLTYILQNDMGNNKQRNKSPHNHLESGNDSVSIVTNEMKMHLDELVKLLTKSTIDDLGCCVIRGTAKAIDSETTDAISSVQCHNFVSVNDTHWHLQHFNTETTKSVENMSEDMERDKGKIAVKDTETEDTLENNTVKRKDQVNNRHKEHANISNIIKHEVQVNDKTKGMLNTENETRDHTVYNIDNGKHFEFTRSSERIDDKDLNQTDSKCIKPEKSVKIDEQKENREQITSQIADMSRIVDRKKLGKILRTWRVNEGMQDTIRQIVYTVLWTLNIGRQEKNLQL